MSNHPNAVLSEEKGSALVITVLVMLALTAIGLTAIRVSTLDNKIAANYKFHKMTYYATNGGCQMTSELLEQSLDEEGFGAGEVVVDGFSIYNGDFQSNEQDMDNCSNNDPSETNYDILVPDLGQANVYIKVYGNKGPTTGAGTQQFAGDKGVGKSIAAGGMQAIYAIRGFGRGLANSQARVHISWAHIN